jgi:hypothetical protein
LPEAATVLADFSRQSKPEWLRGAGKRYPGRSEQASVAASLVRADTVTRKTSIARGG